MGWEAALAADVEHMPLMIHTACGRSAAAAELGASTSDSSLAPPSFFWCVLCFVLFTFFPHKGGNSRGRLFMHFSSCLTAPLKEQSRAIAFFYHLIFVIFVVPFSLCVASFFSHAVRLQSDPLFCFFLKINFKQSGLQLLQLWLVNRRQAEFQLCCHAFAVTGIHFLITGTMA